jgi:hypothetical protein
MPRDDVLIDREELFGESMDTLIPKLLEKHGHRLFLVATELKVYPNTVRHWLSKRGWTFDHEINRWVKSEPSTESHTAA